MSDSDLIISKSDSNAIVYIRTFAMLSIVICHFFQSLQMYKYSSIFNVGVQVFLFMSGYLYGHKFLSNFKVWYFKRWEKIVFPAFVFFICMLPLYFALSYDFLKWYHLPVYVLNLQGFKVITERLGAISINGMQHLWFVTAILVAYLFTPLLQRFRLSSQRSFIATILLMAVSFVFLPMRIVWVLEWCLIYAMGYYYAIIRANRLNGGGIITFYHSLLVIMFTISLLLLQQEDLLSNFAWRNRLFHITFGLSLFVFSLSILSRLSSLRVPNIMRILDKYSYWIFLVHFPIMIGPFSLSHITENVYVNILIMVSATFLSVILFIKIMEVANIFLTKITKYAKHKIS